METEVKTETRDETGGCCAPQGAAGNAVPRDDEAIVDRVRERYGDIALESTGCGCGNAGTGGVAEDEVARRIGYVGEEVKELPEEANLGHASALIDELHNSDFPIPGHALVDLQFESSLTRFVESRRLYHCTVTFKGLTVSD